MFPLTLSDCKSYLNSFKILLILRALKSPLLNTKRVHSMGPSFFAQLSKSFIYIFLLHFIHQTTPTPSYFMWKLLHAFIQSNHHPYQSTWRFHRSDSFVFKTHDKAANKSDGGILVRWDQIGVGVDGQGGLCMGRCMVAWVGSAAQASRFYSFSTGIIVI